MHTQSTRSTVWDFYIGVVFYIVSGDFLIMCVCVCDNKIHNGGGTGPG